MLVLGISSVFANGGDDKKKKGSDTGTLSIRTTEESYPVSVDGNSMGMTGVGSGRDIDLSPGFHTVEVFGPDGRTFKGEIEIVRGRKNCLCLKIVRTVTSTPCPYRFHLNGPDNVSEGDLVTFAAINDGTAPIPLRYSWKVTPSSARVTSGLGTPSITVSSAGMGKRTINAELDVNDSVYDNKCRQIINVPTTVTPLPDLPPGVKPFKCDEFEARTADDDKARYDNCVIQAQNTPDAQIYLIIYPGTDKVSMTRNTYEKLSKRALDYMVKNRGFDPRRISIVKGSSRIKTSYEIWIVPPGATPPVAQ